MNLAFSKLGSDGRLGNSLFQACSMMGLAHSSGRKLNLPPFSYSKYFKGIHPIGPQRGMQVREPEYHYCGDFVPKTEVDFDVLGYLQSYKYWQEIEAKVKEHFEWEPKFLASVKLRNKHLLNGDPIAIHIRRGDYIGNSEYVNLHPVYYLSALEKHFPDWQERPLLVFSDDQKYARLHFGCLKNARFSDAASDIEDLCLMSQCSALVMANSSFSWFGAYLGKKKKVVRPTEHFAGNLAKKCDIKDLYPSDWIAHTTEKLDLRDTVFTIPVHYDSTDRKQNLGLSVCMLQRDFDCEIIVGEQGSNEFGYFKAWCRYVKYDMPAFHRTRMLNDMALKSDAVIVVNYDADVLMPTAQIWDTVRRIRKGVDMVYPYGGEFARVPRNPWFKQLEKAFDVGILCKEHFSGMGEGSAVSEGGCVAFNKESFIRGGMENEGYISFGNEDVERHWRFRSLGFRVERVSGPLFHIDHKILINSTNRHPHGGSNRQVWENISKLSPKELWDHVKTWPWSKINKK